MTIYQSIQLATRHYTDVNSNSKYNNQWWFGVTHLYLENRLKPVKKRRSSTGGLTKQNLGLTSESEYKNFASNAYIHMRTVLDELEKPVDWHPGTINPRYHTLIENESAIYESLFEVCEQKSLIWTGELNEELTDIARKFLMAHGYKEKK